MQQEGLIPGRTSNVVRHRNGDRDVREVGESVSRGL